MVWSIVPVIILQAMFFEYLLFICIYQIILMYNVFNNIFLFKIIFDLNM